MNDSEDPNETQKISRKEELRLRRRQQYREAKERFEKSDFAKAAKEKQREYRRSQYKLAKERAKAKATKKMQREPDTSTGCDETLRQGDNHHSQKPKSKRLEKNTQTDTHVNVNVDAKAQRDADLWKALRPASQLPPKLRLIKCNHENDDSL